MGPALLKIPGKAFSSYGTHVKALQAAGTYADKLIFSGFEWDMPTHDHIGIGLFDGAAAGFRAFNDAAPNIMFAIEGMVGNQMEPDRGGYTAAYTDDNALLRVYGGVDYVVAKLGGPWDALLGEGRRIWNLTDSDTHFKIVGGNSSGYFPGEYAKNYVFNSATGAPALKDLLAGLRSGKMFSVYGDLVNALDFNLASKDDRKEMGDELKVAGGDKVTITIRFKSPAKNNYEKPVDSGTSANVTQRFNDINDRNYRSLWFYSNPVFVSLR